MKPWDVTALWSPQLLAPVHHFLLHLPWWRAQPHSSFHRTPIMASILWVLKNVSEVIVGIKRESTPLSGLPLCPLSSLTSWFFWDPNSSPCTWTTSKCSHLCLDPLSSPYPHWTCSFCWLLKDSIFLLKLRIRVILAHPPSLYSMSKYQVLSTLNNPIFPGWIDFTGEGGRIKK